MKSLIMAAASKIVKDPVLVDIPLDGSVVDRKGLFIPTVMGYPNGVPVFETIDGRPALKLTGGVGVRYQLPDGAAKLCTNDEYWKLEAEVRFANLPTFKHDSILATRLSSLGASSYRLSMWNREQSGNRTIVTGMDSTSETAPILIETTTPGSLVWIKYAIDHTKVDNVRTMRLLRNDVVMSTKVVTGDYSADIFDILWNASNANPFLGWMRNVKIYR